MMALRESISNLLSRPKSFKLFNDSDGPLKAGLSAVIQTKEKGGEKKSYWALQHTGPKADFHLPDNFTLTL
ncbi:MAG: hypothetical protein HYV97_07580 [Bdellovibrio sp.]|nr:hypothetical protein [Bdellovibrio sp.]